MAHAVPDVPPAPRRPARRRSSRSSRPTRPTPTSCSTGRWPWSTTTSRSGPRPRPAARAGRQRAGGHGALVRPARRVPRVRRDARAQPAAGPRAWRPASAARWRSATCPTCSATSPRCPSCSASSGSSTRWCGAACPSAIDRSGFWWSSPDGSTVRAEYLPRGYGNGALVPDDAKALRAPHRRVRGGAGRPARRARSSG